MKRNGTFLNGYISIIAPFVERISKAKALVTTTRNGCNNE